MRKSLYGLQQAPLSRFEHLETHLESHGFKVSSVDQCLFVNKKAQIFCLVYINDMIWVAPDQTRIDHMLESLNDELEMTIEGDVTSFLNIEFKNLPTGAVQMLQLGLIEQVLKTTGMQDCKPN